jgi:hypothetical protein
MSGLGPSEGVLTMGENGPSASVLLEEIKGGWRITVRDHYGETRGWCPTYPEAADQARHVINAHRVAFAGPQTRANESGFTGPSSPEGET